LVHVSRAGKKCDASSFFERRRTKQAPFGPNFLDSAYAFALTSTFDAAGGGAIKSLLAQATVAADVIAPGRLDEIVEAR
jgi:hypothetical protein